MKIAINIVLVLLIVLFGIQSFKTLAHLCTSSSLGQYGNDQGIVSWDHLGSI